MTTSPIRIAVFAAVGVAAVLALAACSSSGSSAGGANSPAAPPPGAGSRQQQVAGNGTSEAVNLTEFHITLSSRKRKPGTYTFRVTNSGSITHALTVDGPGVKDESTGDIASGASSTLRVTLKAGSYEIYCPIGPHKMEGMDEMVQVT